MRLPSPYNDTFAFNPFTRSQYLISRLAFDLTTTESLNGQQLVAHYCLIRVQPSLIHISGSLDSVIYSPFSAGLRGRVLGPLWQSLNAPPCGLPVSKRHIPAGLHQGEAVGGD